MNKKFTIPNKSNLTDLKFDYIDSTIDQYYRPVQGYFMQKRLRIIFEKMFEDKFDNVNPNILDLGYGGGTFFPALSIFSKNLYGIDLHEELEIVNEILRKENVKADIRTESIFKTSFETGFFDCIVCVSVFEHFFDKEIDRAFDEIKRITKNKGSIYLGFPTKNIISNFIIKNILGFEPDKIHPSGHSEIISKINNHFDNFEVIKYPNFLPSNLGLYCVVKITNDTK